MQDIEEALIIRLRDISHTMRGLYEGKGSQKRVLIVLREAAPVTQRELTKRLGIQPGSASEVIAKLENAGLICRVPSGTDRRTMELTLTEAGRQEADTALGQRRQRHKEMFSVFSEEEQGQLLTLLEKLNADWERRYPLGTR